MADKINGYGSRVGLDVGPSRGRAVSRPERQADAGTTQRARSAGDEVQITGTAARLKAVEARLAELPDVDQARVDALRKRVESGEYKPDADRVARKLARMERDLA